MVIDVKGQFIIMEGKHYSIPNAPKLSTNLDYIHDPKVCHTSGREVRIKRDQRNQDFVISFNAAA